MRTKIGGVVIGELRYMGTRPIRAAKADHDRRRHLASVTINGEQRRVRARHRRIAELIAELGLDPLRVAVERNLEIVPRSTFGEVDVEDGDDYEIVHFVGGG